MREKARSQVNDTRDKATDKLNKALTEIFAERDTKDKLAAQNISGIASNAAQAKDFIVKEIASSKAIIEGLGLKPA